MGIKPDNTNSPKRSLNLSINSQLIAQARVMKINLSNLLEQRLHEVIVEDKRERWVRENREAIEEYNCRIENDGLFSDGKRRF